MTIALVIVAAPFVLAAFVALARATRAQRHELDERRRLEAMDERRAAANLYPADGRVEVAPQRPPAS